MNTKNKAELKEFSKLIKEVAPSRFDLQLRTILANPLKERQLLIVMDTKSVLLDWDQSAEDRYHDVIDITRVHKQSFLSSVNYTDRLFVVANHEHGYILMIDSVGVVHYFFDQFRRNGKSIYGHTLQADNLNFYPGQNILYHAGLIGEVGLDWRNDLLVIYNIHTNCIESIKLTNLAHVYSLICFPADFPQLQSLIVNVVEQKVAYFVGKEIRFVSLFGSHQSLVMSTGTKILDSNNKTFLLTYDYDTKKVMMLRTDQAVIKSIGHNGEWNEMMRNNTEKLIGANYLTTGKSLLFWYNPKYKMAYLYHIPGELLVS